MATVILLGALVTGGFALKYAVKANADTNIIQSSAIAKVAKDAAKTEQRIKLERDAAIAQINVIIEQEISHVNLQFTDLRGDLKTERDQRKIDRERMEATLNRILDKVK